MSELRKSAFLGEDIQDYEVNGTGKLEKAKRVWVKPGAKRKGYYRMDPREKKAEREKGITLRAPGDPSVGIPYLEYKGTPQEVAEKVADGIMYDITYKKTVPKDVEKRALAAGAAAVVKEMKREDATFEEFESVATDAAGEVVDKWEEGQGAPAKGEKPKKGMTETWSKEAIEARGAAEQEARQKFRESAKKKGEEARAKKMAEGGMTAERTEQLRRQQRGTPEEQAGERARIAGVGSVEAAKVAHTKTAEAFDREYDRFRARTGVPAGDPSIMKDPKVAAEYKKVSAAYDKLMEAQGKPYRATSQKSDDTAVQDLLKSHPFLGESVPSFSDQENGKLETQQA